MMQNRQTIHCGKDHDFCYGLPLLYLVSRSRVNAREPSESSCRTGGLTTLRLSRRSVWIACGIRTRVSSLAAKPVPWYYM